MPSLRGFCLNFRMNFILPKTRIMGLSEGEELVILAQFVLSQYQHLTDGEKYQYYDNRILQLS